MYSPSLSDRFKDVAKFAMEIIVENPLYVLAPAGIAAWFAFLCFLVSSMASHADEIRSALPPTF